MSISVMKEGELMGRGIKNRDLEARTRARAKAAAANGSPVVVLGAGPAGLLAAHAVALAGGDPVIFSAPDDAGAPVKSELSGAIFLHEPIPDVTTAAPDGLIHFAKVGSREAYAWKVYGSRFAPCSWDKFDEGDRPAWALQPVYDDLWKRYSDKIVPLKLDHESVKELIENFPSIVSTIPAPALCKVREDGRKSHSFASRTIWITDVASDATHVMRDISRSQTGADSVIVYDGIAGAAYSRYRSSIIFGNESTEYADEYPGARTGMKVMRPTECSCHPEIVRAGRWGKWTPGVLVHHAFRDVWDRMFTDHEEALNG
jgi:hypothetical protein